MLAVIVHSSMICPDSTEHSMEKPLSRKSLLPASILRLHRGSLWSNPSVQPGPLKNNNLVGDTSHPQLMPHVLSRDLSRASKKKVLAIFRYDSSNAGFHPYRRLRMIPRPL